MPILKQSSLFQVSAILGCVDLEMDDSVLVYCVRICLLLAGLRWMGYSIPPFSIQSPSPPINPPVQHLPNILPFRVNVFHPVPASLVSANVPFVSDSRRSLRHQE